MSGGQLVVLDRLGRDVKRYPLPEGLATLGSDPACDIRIMLPTVSPHHATVVVHTNQTVVRNVSTGETLVNGRAVSVAALRHGDCVEIGGRALRWEYTDQTVSRPLAPEPALYSRARPVRGSSPRRGRRSAATAAPPRSAALRLALEMQQRASMPGQLGRQVAIVQPQRREQAHTGSMTPPRQNSSKRSRASKSDSGLDTSLGNEPETSTRKSTAARPSHKNTSLQGTTKASMWIESRKSSRGRSSVSLPPTSPRAHSARKATPLRLAVLRRAQSASKAKVTKIEAPLTVDHTKQAAILLMTRHTPKKSITPPRPALVLRKRPPHTVTSRDASPLNVTQDDTLVELSDSNMTASPAPRRSRSSQFSPLLPSPKKSALKDPTAKKSTRKTESIKFDLSNLENHDDQSQDVLFLSDVTRNEDSRSESNLTLHYDSSIKSPSPRKSIHSRSSRILGRTLGTSVSESQASVRSTLTPESPRPRKSSRVSVIVQKALETTGNSRYSHRTTKSLSDESYDTTVASAFKTRTLSPRSPSQKNMESYSIVDLLSDSNQTGNSVYDSMRTTKSSGSFNTPRNSTGRKTRSTIDPSLLTSSTPYVAKTTRGSKRSLSSPNISRGSPNASQASRGSARRSKSLSTPENTQKHISVNSTRVSRASRSRSRLNDSDLLLISTVTDDESPRSSKRARTTKTLSPAKSPIISPKTDTTVGGRKTRSISSPKSPILSPKSNITLGSRKTKSISPKSPVLSPRTFTNNTRKTKSASSYATPTPSPKNISVVTRKTRSILSPRSPVSSPKQTSANNTRRSSPKSPLSPKTDATKTKSVSPNSPNCTSSATNSRKTRSKISINTVSPTSEGLCTPENRHSPVEVGTPVLSIQSLLDSSQSSLTSLRSTEKARASLRRKTIGGIPPKPKKGRASLKSKSFNFGARKTASRLSKDSGTSDRTAPDDDIVTPKSAVKLIQEAVKNKHSTAKKPQSKRSIIDDLNESDIVKQLFNSPVKRKLSQSMTEFSRKQLFDDEDVVVKKPTRNTVALGRTPDNSILNETESYTPEVFVSPLGTPDNSPNLTGIKRLFRKQTPDNDLRNVRGVKGLLRTPRTRRSIKNDLTRVSGVKNVFAKSPKNRLSDVRVKEVFAASPKNDLRRVTGVKSLFQSQKKRKSPKNDLTDVRGVKNLFAASSPVNDLRNVSGVKKTLRKNSPRNDLRDVRGVKKMLRQEKQQHDSADLSGVEELFNESNQSYKDSESLFDKLIGKPPIKAVYSRTFTKKYEKPPTTRRGALHVSIDEIIARPEEWIQKELEKRFEKKANANVSRELQKLATDTVEGTAPIRTSRARNSTLVKSVTESAPRKRSTAENYSAHTLPIKKRSLVEASMKENSRVSRSSNTASTSSINASGRTLPIKKRALVHSTPVKGRATAVLAELGRVSPIALADNSARFTTTVLEVPALETSTRSTKSKPKASKIVVTSPKETRGKVSLVVSPKKTVVVSPKNTKVVVSPKITRKSAKNDSGSKKRATLVVVKKSPVLSPKPAKATTDEQVKSPSPKKRTTRRQKMTDLVAEADKPKSPKRTRGKRVSLVISKPSPKMKPRAAKAQPKEVPAQTSEVQDVPEKKRRMRKNTTAPTEVEKKSESPKATARATRNRKTTEVAKEDAKVTEKTQSKAAKAKKEETVEDKPAAKTRGKKADVSVETNKGRATRGRNNNDVVEEKIEAPKRGRKTKTKVEKKPAAQKRGIKSEVEIEKPVPKRGIKAQVEEQEPVAPRRGRNAKVEVEKKTSSPKKGIKIQAGVEAKPQRRGRNVEVVEQSPKRGRKTETKEEKPVAQTSGRKTEVAQKEVKVAQKRGQKADKSEAQSKNNEIASPKAKRGKVSEPAQERKTRGRRAEPEIEAKPTRAASKADVNRKRKSTAEEELPSKVRKTRNGDVADAKTRNIENDSQKPESKKGRQSARGKQSAAEPAPASRDRKPAAATQQPPTGKRAKRVIAKPASPAAKRVIAKPASPAAKRVIAKPASPAAKRTARAKASPKETKRSTRRKR